jgi:hypothetical protein
MRARLVVRALCVQVLLAIAVSQVGTVCPNPPVADQSIGQFISAPRALLCLRPIQFALQRELKVDFEQRSLHVSPKSP